MNARPYSVTFLFQPHERLEINGMVLDRHRERVYGHSWEHAVLEAAASAPAVLATRILDCIKRDAVDVAED